ncbi:hypothetical protein, partial [Burkholderia contaminans]|uniref:hypothetical protein n=1 Tax=Burkholderia contaminans TaxID=488447 RepID=UPI001C8AFE9F
MSYGPSVNNSADVATATGRAEIVLEMIRSTPRQQPFDLTSLFIGAIPLGHMQSRLLCKRPSSTVVQVVDRGDPRRYRMGSTR